MNLAEIIDGHDDDLVAVISRNQNTSYGELRTMVAAVRGGLGALGIGHGDRVALVCGNGIGFVVSYLAIVGVGATAVPLNPSSPAAELTTQLAAVSAVAVFVDQGASSSWNDLDRAAVPTVRTVVAVGGAVIKGATAWADLVAAEPADRVDVAPEHVAVLMFTSGTAGAPRAAMLTHGNLRANLDQARATHDALAPGDVMYGVIPLFHIFGLNVMLGASLIAGATLLLVQRFDPATAIESFRKRGVTAVLGAPAMWIQFSHFDDAPADSFATVRRAHSGAAKLPVATSVRLQDRFGLTVAEGYGLTEASPIVTSSTGLETNFGSVGAVLDGIELRIVDDDDRDVLVGDAGEIWVRGDNVFAGYLDDPDATTRVLTSDGWLRTGDIGYLDETGHLYLVDRAKDLVIVSGFNVYPAEVEEVLGRHPGVADVGVVGVPHPQTGEAVKAYVVLAPGADLGEDDLIGHARDLLARYKCPSKIVFVDQLPRNATGKLVRRRLDLL